MTVVKRKAAGFPAIMVIEGKATGRKARGGKKPLIEVIEPAKLRARIAKRLADAAKTYGGA